MMILQNHNPTLEFPLSSAGCFSHFQLFVLVLTAHLLYASVFTADVVWKYDTPTVLTCSLLGN